MVSSAFWLCELLQAWASEFKHRSISIIVQLVKMSPPNCGVLLILAIAVQTPPVALLMIVQGKIKTGTLIKSPAELPYASSVTRGFSYSR